MLKFSFSEVTKRLRSAKSIKINEIIYKAKMSGSDPTVLSLGEAYFDIPNFGFDDALVQDGYHYSHSQGLPDLRNKIVGYLAKTHSAASLDMEDNIIISMGSKALTYMSMQLVLNPSDEVLLHEPAWLSYEDQASLCGAIVRYIPYQASLQDIAESISAKTKLIVINNPNNPAGSVYNFAELQKLIAKAEDLGVFVLVDEAYSDFSLTDEFTSAATLVPKYSNLIMVNSISKNFGMSGWRIGFAIADKHIIEKLTIINQHIVTCAPTMLQMYINKNFDAILDVCKAEIDILIRKRLKVEKLLKKYNFRYIEGGATFYFFVELVAPGNNAANLASELLEHNNIAVVPGDAYGKTTSHFIRLSFGTESIDRIEKALQIISNKTSQ